MARRTRLVAARLARRGFTLVELLVVISIIGMLAALLLPAVNQAREAGRRTTCLNNQKQIGLGLFQYEQKQGRYPGYVNPQATITASGGTAVSRPVGWLFSILPYLERNDIVDQYGSPAWVQYNKNPSFYSTYATGTPPTAFSPPNVYLKLAICPSDVRAETKGASSANENQNACSYVVNCGMKDVDPTYSSSMVAFKDGNGNVTPRDWAGNGVFHFNYPYIAGSATNSTVSPLGEFGYANTTGYSTSNEQLTAVSSSFISSGDGTSTTLMLSENVDCGEWADIWESQVGFVWQAGFDGSGNPAPVSPTGDNIGSNLLHINDQLGLIDSASTSGTGTTPNKYSFARPSSYHPGGVVASFCDAHTTFLADTIDYLVYCQLMTPRAKAAQIAPSTTALNYVPFGSNVTGNTNFIYTKALSEGSY